MHRRYAYALLRGGGIVRNVMRDRRATLYRVSCDLEHLAGDTGRQSTVNAAGDIDWAAAAGTREIKRWRVAAFSQAFAAARSAVARVPRGASATSRRHCSHYRKSVKQKACVRGELASCLLHAQNVTTTWYRGW